MVVKLIADDGRDLGSQVRDLLLAAGLRSDPVGLDRRPTPHPRDVPDALMPISQEDALLVGAHTLTSTMASGQRRTPVAGDERAMELKMAAARWVGDDASWFTNGMWTRDGRYDPGIQGWSPLTSSTFDSAVAARGQGRLFLLVAADED